jgi:hypothetical protein
MLNPGDDVRAAVSAVAPGTTICLNAGSFGSIDLSGIQKSANVTLRSAVGSAASASFVVKNSRYITLQSLTISKLDMWQVPSTNISILNNTFKGQFLITATGNQTPPAEILIDGNTFDGWNKGPNDLEGRLQIYDGGGVTVTNNHFGGGGESDGIQMGGYGGTIGPGNVFEDILFKGAAHVDAIQLYGEVSHHTVVGNYFRNNSDGVMAPSGGEFVTVTNNVFVGTNIGYPEIFLGHQTSPVFTHNVVSGMTVMVDQGNATPSRGAVVSDNVFVVNSGIGANCDGCSFVHNLFDATSTPYGGSNVIGAPKFVGGAPSWSAYRLTADSVGYKAAPSGTSMGIN